MSKPTATDNKNSQVRFVQVGKEQDGQRLDNFLFNQLKGVPKTHIYRIIRKGEVRVNKGRAKQTSKLTVGDMVRIPPVRTRQDSSSTIDESRYAFLNRATLYEDDVLLIINKPSGMAVHSGSGIKVGIIEALRAVRKDLHYIELVHRLDRETSGCLVLAKKASALRTLQEEFRNSSNKARALDKRYLALVKGQWKFAERVIKKPLNTQNRRAGERHVVVDQEGVYASSVASAQKVSERASLVEIRLLTGRTHQARVHCLSEGHPIAGDRKYGDKEFNAWIKQRGMARLFLHASSLKFSHPISGVSIEVSAPLPIDCKKTLQELDLV